VAVTGDFNYQQSTGTLGGGNKLEAGHVWFLTYRRICIKCKRLE